MKNKIEEIINPSFSKTQNFTNIFNIIVVFSLFVIILLFSLETSLMNIYIDPNTLEYKYLTNTSAIITSSIFLFIYVLNYFILKFNYKNIASGYFNLKYKNLFIIYASLFYFFYPYFSLRKTLSKDTYKYKYKKLTKEETNFITKTKYKNLLELNSLKHNFFSKFKFISVFLIPVIFISYVSIDNQNIKIETKNISTSTFQESNNSSKLSFTIDSNFLSENSELNNIVNKDAELIFYIQVSQNGTSTQFILNILYDYDLDNDGKDINGNDIYLNINGKPTNKVTDVKISNSNLSLYYLNESDILDLINKYNSEFNIEVRLSNDNNFSEYNSYIIEEAPFFKYVNFENDNGVYFDAKITNKKNNKTEALKDKDNNEYIYLNNNFNNSEAFNWNIEKGSNYYQINPTLNKEYSDYENLKSYVDQENDKVACYKPSFNFKEQVKNNNAQIYQKNLLESSNLPTLNEVTNLSFDISKCPDFYIPIGNEYKINFDNIQRVSNGLTNNNPGYIFYNIEVILIDDYKNDIVYSNYKNVNTPNNIVANELNNNMPIATLNNSCEFYYNDNGNLEKIPNSEPTNIICQNLIGDKYIKGVDWNTVDYSALTIYDFNEDGDYSWPKDYVQVISLNNISSIKDVDIINNANPGNIYNESESLSIETIFGLSWILFLILMSFITSRLYKKYKNALEETMYANNIIVNYFEKDYVVSAFKKFSEGKSFDLEEEKNMAEEKNILFF